MWVTKGSRRYMLVADPRGQVLWAPQEALLTSPRGLFLGTLPVTPLFGPVIVGEA